MLPGPVENQTPPLWRGSLLALECEALTAFFGAASRPSGSKLPRHRVQCWWVVQLTDIKAILPPFSCPQISRILPAGNFITGLKYMTRALD